MEKGIMSIKGKEYVIGPDGRFADLNGNLCGFVNSEIVNDHGLMDEGENFVDLLTETASDAKDGIHPAMPVIMWGAGQIIHAGYERYRQRQAEDEADRAERRAEEMQKRLEEARRKHGQNP